MWFSYRPPLSAAHFLGAALGCCLPRDAGDGDGGDRGSGFIFSDGIFRELQYKYSLKPDYNQQFMICFFAVSKKSAAIALSSSSESNNHFYEDNDNKSKKKREEHDRNRVDLD